MPASASTVSIFSTCTISASIPMGGAKRPSSARIPRYGLKALEELKSAERFRPTGSALTRCPFASTSCAMVISTASFLPDDTRCSIALLKATHPALRGEGRFSGNRRVFNSGILATGTGPPARISTICRGAGGAGEGCGKGSHSAEPSTTLAAPALQFPLPIRSFRQCCWAPATRAASIATWHSPSRPCRRVRSRPMPTRP